MQIAGFMVTDGGPHPADRWADLTANTIVDTILVDSNPNDGSANAISVRLAKRELRNALFAVLIVHHSDVQRLERVDNTAVKKAADAAERVIAPLDPTRYMVNAMDAVNATFAATPFAAHFAKPEVQAVVAQIIGQHTVDVMHIERRWHHDRLTTAKGA